MFPQSAASGIIQAMSLTKQISSIKFADYLLTGRHLAGSFRQFWPALIVFSLIKKLGEWTWLS
jgi:hypothetical protein